MSPVQAAQVNLSEPKHFLGYGKCLLVFRAHTLGEVRQRSPGFAGSACSWDVSHVLWHTKMNGSREGPFLVPS